MQNEDVTRVKSVLCTKRGRNAC